MAIQKKINGFVILNINTDEYSFLRPIEESDDKSTSNVSYAGRQEGTSIESDDKLPISIDMFYENTGILESEFDNIHIAGARVYGISDLNSNFDSAPDLNIIAITNREIPYELIEFNDNGSSFVVDVFNKDEFLKMLDEHNMESLEFLFHTESEIILDKVSYNLNINSGKLINKVLEESDKQWDSAKSILNSPDGDIYSGLNMVWNSIRYLIFAEQILKFNKIINFSAANSFYFDIINSTFDGFSYFETNFLPLKVQFEDIVKKYLNNESGKTIDSNLGPNPVEGPISEPGNIVFESVTPSESNTPLESGSIIIGGVVVGSEEIGGGTIVESNIIENSSEGPITGESTIIN